MCRRGGRYGDRDFNCQLVEPTYDAVQNSWIAFFEDMDVRIQEMFDRMEVCCCCVGRIGLICLSLLFLETSAKEILDGVTKELVRVLLWMMPDGRTDSTVTIARSPKTVLPKQDVIIRNMHSELESKFLSNLAYFIILLIHFEPSSSSVGSAKSGRSESISWKQKESFFAQ